MSTKATMIEIETTGRDRKSTRLNSSHSQISYAVFCLKKKKNISRHTTTIMNYSSPDEATNTPESTRALSYTNHPATCSTSTAYCSSICMHCTHRNPPS